MKTDRNILAIGGLLLAGGVTTAAMSSEPTRILDITIYFHWSICDN
jgi:hypothetical protein